MISKNKNDEKIGFVVWIRLNKYICMKIFLRNLVLGNKFKKKNSIPKKFLRFTYFNGYKTTVQ